jgi:hypothetical protein
LSAATFSLGAAAQETEAVKAMERMVEAEDREDLAQDPGMPVEKETAAAAVAPEVVVPAVRRAKCHRL